MKRSMIALPMVLLMAAASLPAAAQYGQLGGGRGGGGLGGGPADGLHMAGLDREPQIEKLTVFDLIVDESRADHVALAKALPDAIANHLLAEKIVKEATHVVKTLEVGDYGLPAFDTPDDAKKLAADTKTDGLICGDISLVGDATRVRIVVSETENLLFYPPVSIYFTDASQVEVVTDIVCRALQSFFKAEDLQKELEDTWQEPEAGELRFEARPNLTAIPDGEPQSIYLRLEFAAGKFETEERSPLNVAIVLDRSGSMSGEKLEQAKLAAIRIVEGLEPTDRLSFVVYDDTINTPIPNTFCKKPKDIIKTIEQIADGGSTNLGGGLQEGYKQGRKALDADYVNRVILLSDGLANEGETRAEVLAKWAKQEYARDLSTSTIGIGTDYDAKLMEQIAVAGNGGYYYVQTPESINDIIAREFSSLFTTVAEGTKLSLRLAEGVKLESIYGYEVEEKDGAHIVDIPTLRSVDRKFVIAKLTLPAFEAGKHKIADAAVNYEDAISGGTAKMDTSVTLNVGGAAGTEVVDWRVQIDAEEFETTAVMDEIVERLQKEDRDGAVALIHGRILELARMSQQTRDLRSQVQCNILDGLITLIENGTDPESLRYATNNAQAIAYGGIAGNANYQGLGQMRGEDAMARPAMKAGFGGKRQQ
ncbi:MAG TPA: VWA domain-containing protein [Armatimonadota bacterium]|nr:VWA domain-containing protein [Armatimonadota bacterium]